MPHKDQKQSTSEKKKLREEKENNEDKWNLGKQGYDNFKNYGFSDWYGWSIQNWGTKWNAYDPISVEQGCTLEFSTAWEAPFPIIEQLSKQFPETIIFRWADDDIGYNVGEMTLKNGEIIDRNIPKEGSDKAFEMAKSIREAKLSEIDFHPSPVKESLVNVPYTDHEITFDTHDIGAEVKFLLEKICQGACPPSEFQLNFEENGRHTLSFSSKQKNIPAIVASLSRRHPNQKIYYCERIKGLGEPLIDDYYRNGKSKIKSQEKKNRERGR